MRFMFTNFYEYKMGMIYMFTLSQIMVVQTTTHMHVCLKAGTSPKRTNHTHLHWR